MFHPPGIGSCYTFRVRLFSPHIDVALVKLSAFHSAFGTSKQTEILQEIQEAQEHYFCSSVYLRKSTWKRKKDLCAIFCWQRPLTPLQSCCFPGFKKHLVCQFAQHLLFLGVTSTSYLAPSTATNICNCIQYSLSETLNISQMCKCC